MILVKVRRIWYYSANLQKNYANSKFLKFAQFVQFVVQRFCKENICVEAAVKRAVGGNGINFEDTLEKCDIRLSHQFYGKAEVVFER